MKFHAVNFLTRAALAVGVVATAVLPVAGCGSGGSSAATANPTPVAAAGSVPIHGHVAGGASAISGANVQLYAIGGQGAGSTATPLLAETIATDASGNFDVSGNYACPSSTSQLYLVATGGNPGLAAGTQNAALSLMTLLGACNTLSSTNVYPVNEVTTVGSIWPLAPYAQSSTQIGFSSTDSTSSSAISEVSQLVTLLKAVSPGTGIPVGYAVQSAKLYMLADDLHACVVSPGGAAGDGSACGQLFTLATPPGTAAPKNTIDAALRLAQNVHLGVESLFQALPPDAPFEPVLPVAPADLNLALVQVPAAPTITPAAGAYAAGQSVTLNSASAGAAIHYTLDGSAPSLTSAVYDGPLALASNETVNAIAVIEGIGSAVSSAVFSINGPVGVGLTPLSVSLSSSQSQQFTAKVSGTSNAAVTWALNPQVGSISSSGLYAAPALIASAQTVTVSATSVADPTKSATATITLNLLPVVSISVAPASVSLGPSQSQQFTSTVTGTPNSGATWAVSPAVGSVSPTGLYTAPASITSLQTVTVSATSVADPSKATSASVSITPQGPGYTTYYVDNAGGSDSNAGTSPSAPFATVAKVNSIDLQPGQTAAFKAGDVWHEMLTVSRSGAAGAPIHYTSYGAGAQPVIDASDTVTGWSLGGVSGTLPSYVWTHVQASDPLLINFAGVTGIPVSSISNIVSANEYFWDGSTLYVYSGPDPTSTVEIAARKSALTSAGASYVSVSNLEFRGGTDVVYCGGTNPCSNWDFESNTIDSGFAVGLRWVPVPGVSGASLTINNNVFRGTGGSGIGVSNGGSALGDVITNNTMSDHCKIYVAGSSENAFCAAIYLYSETASDGGGEVIRNTISQVGLASGAAYGGGIHADTVLDWDIEHNTVSNTAYPGVELEKGAGTIARYNLLVNTGQYQYFSGLYVRAGEGHSVANMLAEYNTVVGGYWACALGASQAGGAVTATNVTMSMNICTGASSGTELWLDSGFLGAGNSFASNGFGVAAADFVNAGGLGYDGYALLPAPIVDSLAGDPQFVSPSTGDYTLQPTSPDLAIGAFPQL